MKWSKNGKTSPINLAVTSGNGNKEFYMESTRRERKKSAILRVGPSKVEGIYLWKIIIQRKIQILITQF